MSSPVPTTLTVDYSSSVRDLFLDFMISLVLHRSNIALPSILSCANESSCLGGTNFTISSPVLTTLTADHSSNIHDLFPRSMSSFVLRWRNIELPRILSCSNESSYLGGINLIVSSPVPSTLTSECQRRIHDLFPDSVSYFVLPRRN